MGSENKKDSAIRTILTYGEAHKSWLVKGFFGTLGVVFFRLAMPWPLRGVIEVVFPRGSGHGTLLVDTLPAWGEPVLWLALCYIFLAIGLGISEYIQRVNIMRYAANTVHDMRGAAVKGAASMPLSDRVASGDVISRIIGDSARIKAGISGILVHGLQNGILFLAVCAVMLYIKLSLGLIFIVAGLIALFIGLKASKPVAKTAGKQRRKEGDYAAILQEGLDFGGLLETEEINASSARKEVRTTRLIARSSLYVHVVLAAAVGLALWVGSLGVESGQVAPGELFLFIAYALTVHRRMVQVGRQSARSGKVLACTDRIRYFLRGVGDRRSTKSSSDNLSYNDVLSSGLRLEDVKLSAARGSGARARLKGVDLLIKPGAKVAVLGQIGSGKTSLLKLMAGVEVPDKGRIFWDDVEVTEGGDALSSRVTFLPSDPVFPSTNIWKILGLASPEALTRGNEETLEAIRASNIIKGCPKGIEEKVDSLSLSRNEARLLQLAGLLIGESSNFWIIDNPVQGFGKKKGALLLDEIFTRSAGRTVVASFSEKSSVKNFDYVIFLRSGKVRFFGTLPEFEEWKSTERDEESFSDIE
jgi:ABC-type multidrug transport system fused ATPase/permease subunit